MYVPTLHRIRELTLEHRLPFEEVFLIALNRYGLNLAVTTDRVRFALTLATGGDFFVAVCVNTGPSPFYLEDDGTICAEGTPLARVARLERDTCVSSYFRRAHTELTLNSNARSLCSGCSFCGTHMLEADDRVPLQTIGSLRRYLRKLMRSHGFSNLSHVVRTTLCTGCFPDEAAVVRHILQVRDVLLELGFSGRIRYIGAQLGISALRVLRRNMEAFSLSYTVECFTQRSERLRATKSAVSLHDIRDLLSEGKALGFSTNFLYIVGLDELHSIEAGFNLLKSACNRFPVLQVIQRYSLSNSDDATPDANDLSYFLKVRELAERIFGSGSLRPRVWENYRGLWFLTYKGEPLYGIRE